MLCPPKVDWTPTPMGPIFAVCRPKFTKLSTHAPERMQHQYAVFRLMTSCCVRHQIAKIWNFYVSLGRKFFWGKGTPNFCPNFINLGRQPPGAALHSSREPGELWQWLSHDDSTIKIVLRYFIITCFRSAQTAAKNPWNGLGAVVLKMRNLLNPHQNMSNSSHCINTTARSSMS